MEFDSPIKEGDKTCVKIHTLEPLITTYTITEAGTHTTPEDMPEFKEFLSRLAKQFEEYSGKWFTRPVLAIGFIQRASNTWVTENHEPYMGKLKSLLVQQTWNPEHIQILSHSYQITWKLTDSIFMPHTISGQDDYAIPYVQRSDILQLVASPRSRAKQMLRKLRLQVAIAEWKMSELSKAYYERYGAQEDASSSSALSSELNSDIDEIHEAP